MTLALHPANLRSAPARQFEGQVGSMIAYLRKIVIGAGGAQERFHAIFLDRGHRFLGDARLGQGGHAALSVRMRDLFGHALSLNARAIIIAHNHPSGDCRPSGADISSTHRLAEIAKALDVELVDHLIITQSSVYSMRAGGNL